MDCLGKEYTSYDHENVDEFLKFVGVPEELVVAYLSSPASEKLDMDGDTYTLTTNGMEGQNEYTFESGVGFDDPTGKALKITFVVDGNKVTQTVVTEEKGTTIIEREYDGDELVITTTSDGWDGVAKRFYKA